MWSIRSIGTPLPGSGSSARKSSSQRSSGPQKNTAVPSGAATAARSASPGLRRRVEHRREQRLRARGGAPGSALSTATATTSGSSSPAPWLSTMRMSPCCHSCTGLLRCGPTCAKPSVRSSASVSGAESASTPISTNAKPSSRGLGRQPVLEHEQRAHGVDRRAVGVGLAEDVVEHLERERAVVAGGQHAGDEVGEVERALAGEAAVVAAPLQDVHAQVRRVGELEVEELLARDAGDRVEVGAAREDVEGVQAGAERRVVGGRDDPPGVVVLVDVAAPGERLVGDPQPAVGGAGGERAQLLGGERVVVDRLRARRSSRRASSARRAAP